MQDRFIRFAAGGGQTDCLPNAQPIRQVHPAASYEYRLADRYLGGAPKRAFDLCASIAALALLSPLFALVAAAITLESPGPVFFRQRRTGFRGRSFYIFKFRTMQIAPPEEDVRQAVPGDSRVTFIGAILRKTSIDELPQLLNVVRGEMSIVGPRPHAVAHDERFCDVVGAYPHRFIARPGITGLAQVSGARGLTDTPEKVRMRLHYDFQYVDNWSFLTDLKIIVRTCRVLLGDRHAF